MQRDPHKKHLHSESETYLIICRYRRQEDNSISVNEKSEMSCAFRRAAVQEWER